MTAATDTRATSVGSLGSRRTLWWEIAALLAAAAAPLVVPALEGAAGGQMTTLFIYGILALALNVMVGFVGCLHLGIAAFFGIGGYTAAILMVPTLGLEWPFAAALAVAVAVATGAGLLLAAPCLRLRGDYLALVTLGFGEVVKVTLRNLENITGGMKGLGPLPPPADGLVVAGLDVGRAFAIDPRWFYELSLLSLAVVVLGMEWLARSKLGRAMAAVREDEAAAASLGVPVARIKLAAFAISSAVAGLAGALYAVSLSTTADPNAYDFNRSVLVLSAVILGGLGSVPGTLIGVAVLIGFDTILAPWADAWLQQSGFNDSGSSLLSLSGWRMALFGIALIVTMRFRPRGLLPVRSGPSP